MRALLIMLLALSTPVVAQTSAAPGGVSDPRVQTLAYDAGQVVRLRVAVNYQLTLILSPDERVENVAVGDSEAWQVTLNQQGDALFLKPLRSNNTTNMTIITDARVYSFELSSAFGPAADTPFTVRFVYPGATASVPGPEARPGIGRYRLSGARALRPEGIDDDGIKTYIEWRPQQVLPAVFAIDERGDETLLDGHMRDDQFVIDGVHRALIFRLEHQTARASRLRVRADR